MNGEECEHKFIFLRQEHTFDGGYKPDRTTWDVYFCDMCLQYKRVKVLVEEEARDRFGYEVKWRVPV